MNGLADSSVKIKHLYRLLVAARISIVAFEFRPHDVNKGSILRRRAGGIVHNICPVYNLKLSQSEYSPNSKVHYKQIVLKISWNEI